MKNLLEKLRLYKTIDPFEEAERQAFITFLLKNDDALERTNLIAHVTASSWIVNKDFTRVLMCYHRIYDSWSWTGGHADGEANLGLVALKEAVEETGINDFAFLTPDFYDVEVIPVPSHYKRGIAVGNHLHLNATYLLMASESAGLVIREDENSGLAWIDADKLDDFVTEKDMLPLYTRLHKKALTLKKRL